MLEEHEKALQILDQALAVMEEGRPRAEDELKLNVEMLADKLQNQGQDEQAKDTDQGQDEPANGGSKPEEGLPDDDGEKKPFKKRSQMTEEEKREDNRKSRARKQAKAEELRKQGIFPKKKASNKYAAGKFVIVRSKFNIK